MLCAHCYQDRLGLTKKVVGPKVGERAMPKPSAILKSVRPRAS